MRRIAALAVLGLLVAACNGTWASDQIDAAAAVSDISVPTTSPATSPESSPTLPPTSPPSASTPSTSTSPSNTTYEPVFEPNDCPMDVSGQLVDRVDCGVLIVPVDRALPDGNQARIAIAVLRSEATSPRADPVIYLHGGPGGNALPDFDQWLRPEHDILETRDLILIDQRGSGYSLPSLNCTEYDGEYSSDRRALRDCFNRLDDEGVDTDRFTTLDIALDVADLRIALGYAEWNLYGISYGTRVALEVMRSAPTGIRSVVLDSPYPPEVSAYLEQAPNGRRAIDSVLSACARLDECDEAFPDLAARLDKLLLRLRDEPISVDVEEWLSGDTIEVYVDDEVFVNGIFGALYDTHALRDVPLAIHRAANDDLAEAARLLGLGDGFDKSIRRTFQDDDYISLADAEGAHWSPECAEEARFSSSTEAIDLANADDPIEQALIGDVRYAFAVCEIWDVMPAREASQSPIVSDLSTLVVVGEFDPITPPLWGEATIDDLTNATLVTVPAAGHGATLETCPESIMLAFLDDPTAELDQSCLDDLGPEFYLE